MSEPPAVEYRIPSSPSLAVVRGSKPRALAHAPAKETIRRRSGEIVAHITGDGYAKDPFFHWLGDLRRGQLRIYGALLRFIDLCAQVGKDGRRRAPKWMIKMIPRWIDAYIEDAYAGDDDPGPAERREPKVA